VSSFPASLLSSRVHLITGRLPRVDRPFEALINFHAADRYRFRRGTTVDLVMAGEGSNPITDTVVPGPRVRAHIVGIVASAGDFVGIAGPGLMFGPGFQAAVHAPLFSLDLYAFRLRHPVDVDAFDASLRGVTGGRPVLYDEAGSGVAQVRRGFHVQAAALWILCAFLSLVAVFIFGQSLARTTTVESEDFATLTAMGMSRGSLFAVGMARAAIVAVGAGVVAGVSAFGLSALTPLGTARLAEPHPGPSAPGTLFALGLVTVVAVVLAVAVIPAWRVAKLRALRAQTAGVSMVARAVSAVIRRPAPGVGARFALEPGRGRSSVPVRSALAASVIGIVALLAALTVGASLDRLLVTPRLYGWNWDVAVPGNFAPGSKDLTELENDPAVAAVAVGTGYGGNLFRVDRSATQGFLIDRAKGDAGPTLLDGRVPTAADEVAIGPKTLRAVRSSIGRTVHVSLVGSNKANDMRVVGVVVLPFDGDTATVGEGLWMTLVGGRTFDPSLPAEDAIVQLVPGADRRTTAARLHARYQGESPSSAPPQTVRNLAKISSLTAILAGILAALAAGTLMHMLATSIKRRRRDVAILKTLGLDRRQVRGVICWQAAVFTGAAVALSLPLGALAGRSAWTLIAQSSGVAPSPGVPAGGFAIVAAVSVAGATLLALLPARSASRTRPALVLRSE